MNEMSIAITLVAKVVFLVIGGGFWLFSVFDYLKEKNYHDAVVYSLWAIISLLLFFTVGEA